MGLGLQKIFSDIGAAGDKALKAVSDGAAKFDELSQKSPAEKEAILREFGEKAGAKIHIAAGTIAQGAADVIKDPSIARDAVKAQVERARADWGDILGGPKKPPGSDGPTSP